MLTLMGEARAEHMQQGAKTEFLHHPQSQEELWVLSSSTQSHKTEPCPSKNFVQTQVNPALGKGSQLKSDAREQLVLTH